MLTGITGGIGSGKSVVSRILRLNGYEVYDCDLEARRLMDSSLEISQEIEKRWSDRILYAGGSLDRAALAEIIFADDAERKWLNALVHGRVRSHFEEWRCERAGQKRLFVESAILCTAGLDAICDDIWIVEAPVDVRTVRLALRSGLSEAQARDRINAQNSESELLRNFSGRKHILHNDGTSSLLCRIFYLLKLTDDSISQVRRDL